MKFWPWLKHDDLKKTAPEDIDEAREARKKSERELHEIRGQRHEVDRIASRLRQIRQENHLAEILERSIKPKEDPDE
jgi:hypothetical protein